MLIGLAWTEAERWAFLLRPAWLALFVVVIAFAYLCFTVLAPWQLGKNTKTSRENAQISRSLTSDPVPLTTLLPQQDSSAPDEQWQRAEGAHPPRRRAGVRRRRARDARGGPRVRRRGRPHGLGDRTIVLTTPPGLESESCLRSRTGPSSQTATPDWKFYAHRAQLSRSFLPNRASIRRFSTLRASRQEIQRPRVGGRPPRPRPIFSGRRPSSDHEAIPHARPAEASLQAARAWCRRTPSVPH